MGQMNAAARSGAGASHKMIAVDKSEFMDEHALSAVKNDIEKFCKLMERGLEVDLPSINSIRVLFVDNERSALHLSAKAAEVFAAEMAIKFENVLRINALTEIKHASRVEVLHKEKGKVVHLEFDVDTDKSRDILAEMLSKVVAVYSSKKKKRSNEDATITGALSSMFSNLSSSLWYGADSNPKPVKNASSPRRSTAYRRQISSEGRDLFRNSMDGLDSPRR